MLTESLNIYVIDKDGNKVTFPNVEGMQPAIVDVNLNRERMAGAPTNTSTLMYPVCLDSYWTKKEFIEVGSERFYVKQVPTSEKNIEDTRYKHEITFVSERDILENVFFFDCVTQDPTSQVSDKPRTNTTDFSFYGDLNELVQRLNDSLSYSKIYDPKGENGFCIVIDDDVEIGEAKEVSMTDAYFATAMQEIYNVFEVPYYWVGKVCHVGYQENEITEPFEYGSGNGLVSVQKTNAEFRLINRITGQGSADNIPYYYPNTDPNGIPVTEYKNMQESDISGVVPTKIANLEGGIIGKRIYFGEIQKGNGTVLINEQKQYAKKETWQINKDDQDVGYDVVERDYSPGFEKYEIPFYANVGDKIDLTKAIFEYKVTISSDYNVTCNPTPNKTSVENWSDTVNADIFVIDPNNSDWRITTNDLTYTCTISGLHKLTIHCNPIYDYINCHVDFPENKDVVPVEATFAFTLTGSIFLTTTEGNVVVCDNVIYPEKKIPFNVSDWGALRLLNISPAFDANKGIVVDEILQGYDYSSCSQFCILDLKKTNIMSKLMPSVYRQTEGAERFYNAKNETYKDENGNYYSFNNPYVPSEPLEGKQDFEDIKPTITGITNENGELFGEIAAVAFDDTDSDDLSVEDASDANANTAKPVHPYFYVKLHKFSGENGFNLFKQGLAQGAMTFNFITGSCAGCSFKVQVSEGKQVDNHYEFENHVQVDEQGNIVAGDSGDKIKASNPIASQQDTMTNSVWVALEKDNSTFGVLMPNATNNYRPQGKTELREGDKFVITNILLPTQYITAAEKRLDAALVKYMSENNDEKFTFSIKFSRIYLQEHPEIAEKINENTKLHVKYNNVDYPLYVSSYTRKSDDNILDEISVELSEKLTIAQNKSKEQMDSIMGNVNEQINSAIQNNNNNTSQGVSVNDINSLKALLSNKLSRVTNDTAQGVITFLKGLVSEGKITAKQGVEIGSFVTGLIGGSGARIDKDGNGEMESLVVRQFLEVPELRFNRIDVVSGELWNSICFGTIEAVDTKKRIVTLKLQDGELSGIEVGDICRGIFHCLESSNPSTDIDEDECGFQQMAGFSTSYFTPTEVYDNGARFKYSLRSGTSVHPQVGMKFAVYGSFTNPARRASAYHTRTYTRYLNAVDTWRISPDKNIYGQQGNLEGLTINEMEMHGYGGYFHNIYMSGVHVEFDRDWLDHNLPKVYSVHLSTYEHTIVTDIEGNPLNGLEELRNVITGESNVMSGDDNVIATRLAVTTTILAHKGTTPLLFSDTMDEGRFIVTLACVGCTAEVDNGVVKVTSIDKESAEHYVDISVNCEGEGVYVQTFNIPMVKQGENGITADLDNEMATIAANDKGKPIVEPFEEIVSHGQLWYGNDEMYLVKAEVAVPGGITVADVTTVTDEEGQHNYLPIVDNKYCTLRITNVGEDAADISQIRIELFGRIKEQMNTEYSKVVVFTLNKVRMGENAQNYSLLTTSPIMQADGKGNVTTTQVACSVLVSDGKTMTELTTANELTEHALRMKVQLYNANDAASEEVAYTIGTNLVVGTSTIGGLKLTKDSVRLVFSLYWQDLLIDKEGIPMIKDGSSTVRIDLDNENDSILYNDAGEKVSSDCYTNIKVYDGSKNVTSSCTLSIDYRNNVLAYISGTQCYVTSVSSTTGYARIAAYYPADGNTYYAIFSIKRLVGEDKYEIVTSPTTVSYDPNKKEYSAASVKVDVYRTDQNGVRSIISSSNTLPSGYALQYSTDGSVWAAISAGSSVTPDYTLPHIFLRIVDNNGKVRDSETVPVVIGGSDSTSYWLISPVSAFSLSPSGSYTPSGFSVTMKKKTGEGEVDNCSDFYLSVWGVGLNGGIEYVTSKSEKSYQINVSQPSSNKSYTSLLVVASSDVPSSNNYPSKIVAEMGIGIVTDGKAGDAGNSIFLIDKGVFKPGESYKFAKMEGVANAYERDWVLYNPGGGSYYAYAVKTMSTTVSTAPSVAGASDSNWEFLNKHESVLADTLIGVNCNIGGFAVTNEQFASQNYLTNDAGICINGKNGEIIAKQSPTSEWKVDTSGNMSIGNPSGQRIVVNPETRDIKVFDSSNNLVTTISGETVSSISNLFGSAGSISAVSSAVGFTIRGTGTIQTKKEYITLSNQVYADAGAKLSASCSLYLSATPYTDTGDATKPQIMGNSISARIVYTDSYGNIYGALTGNFSVVGDIMSGGAGSNTLRGSAIVKSSGYYYVKLEVKYAVGAASPNLVAISNIENIGLSLVADNYLSRLLANGFCFGSTNANYIAALNESSGNMHFDFKSGTTQLELTNSNFVLKSQYGKVFPTILWVYCSYSAISSYFTATGIKPTFTKTSTGSYVIDYSACNLGTLSASNTILSVTSVYGEYRTIQIGNLSTGKFPILSFDKSGNAADTYFILQVQRII